VDRNEKIVHISVSGKTVQLALPPAKEESKRKAGGSSGNRIDKGKFFLVGQRKGDLWQIMTNQKRL
jgi:hypothetical protein